MSVKQSGRKSPPPQEYLEQRRERLGIAASEFRTDINGLTEQEARQLALTVARTRCQNKLQEAFQSNQPVLFEALMGLGKTHGAIK
jgi:ribosomal protein L13E